MSNTTTTTLLDAIKGLPRYDVEADYDGCSIGIYPEGEFLKFADVLAVVTKGVTLAAPIAKDGPDGNGDYYTMTCGCVADDYQVVVLCAEHAEQQDTWMRNH